MTSKEQLYRLKPNDEVRFIIKEVPKRVCIELLDGNAEIFGVEMLINKIYKFSSSFAVVTWEGCTLKMTGRTHKTYSVCSNHQVYDLHNALEEHRSTAEKNSTRGPITLITGPTDVGKSTLTRSLLNYAARLGRTPLYVDLDVGQSSLSIPGTLGVLPISTLGDVVKGFNDDKVSVYFFGYKSPGFNPLLYFLLIDRLSKTLLWRLRDSKHLLHSGAIIDTCGWVTGTGYKSILVAAESFQVTTTIVISDKNLYSQLQRDLPSSIKIIFTPRLDGVVERSKSIRTHNRNAMVQEYFYGSQNSLKPYTFKISFSEIQVFKVSTPITKVPFDCPENVHKYIPLLPVTVSARLKSHVLALSYADTKDEIISTSILGFICVLSVDMDHGVLTILSPQPSPLPKKFLLMGEIQFVPKES